MQYCNSVIFITLCRRILITCSNVTSVTIFFMKVIAVFSQKGGSGKTTLTKHLAVEASNKYNNVAVVDFDPQGSISRWFSRRKLTKPVLVNLDLGKLKTELKELANFNADMVFIDCPGVLVDYLRPILKAADAAVIPVKPSPDDIELMANNLAEVKRAGTNACIVVNEVTPNDGLVSPAQKNLKQDGHKVLGVINKTNLFAKASLKGVSITELPKSAQGTVKAVSQVRSIFNELDKELNK